MTEEWEVRRKYIIRRFPIPKNCRKEKWLELPDDADRYLIVSHPHISRRIIGCQVTETELIIVIEHIEKMDRKR